MVIWGRGVGEWHSTKHWLSIGLLTSKGNNMGKSKSSGLKEKDSCNCPENKARETPTENQHIITNTSVYGKWAQGILVMLKRSSTHIYTAAWMHHSDIVLNERSQYQGQNTVTATLTNIWDS